MLPTVCPLDIRSIYISSSTLSSRMAIRLSSGSTAFISILLSMVLVVLMRGRKMDGTSCYPQCTVRTHFLSEGIEDFVWTSHAFLGRPESQQEGAVFQCNGYYRSEEHT